jgi:ubiquinone/menaquinone biosynthesis C-methylase UbiE
VNSKERFSNRVAAYVQFRPSYPKDAINYLYDVVCVQPTSEIADIGAGTGIFTKLLLERGSKVTAVEPNEAMREAAGKMLGKEPNFRIVSGSAEDTGLPDHSVDFVVCAQSFHWFERMGALSEFRRILRPDGRVILIWNSRLTHGTPFLEEYEQLLHKFGTDYEKVSHKNISKESLLASFKESKMQEVRFTNRQLFDFEELSGRLLSSSYSPLLGHPNYEPMMEELRNLFERNQIDGKVSFDYETEVFWGDV